MHRRIIPIVVLAMASTACGGGDESSATTAPSATTEAPAQGGDAVNGEQLFNGTCIACHGPGGEGVEGLGKPLPGSEFVAGLSEAELVEFLLAGRSADDPLNTTGVGMPPKGGNPALSEADLADIAAYVKSL